MASKQATAVAIRPPNFQWVSIPINGLSPYVQHAFGAKAREEMHGKQASGARSKSRNTKEAKDFEEQFEQATHTSSEGWYGIPAPAFRAAMISACRAAGFVMTRAKLGVFIEPDGFDATDHTPLVRIYGERLYDERPVRLDSGVVDLRARPMWAPGWTATVRVRFDGDMFSPEDVCNLLHRVGLQMGIGEGRADSKKSCGMGWGEFTVRDAGGEVHP